MVEGGGRLAMVFGDPNITLRNVSLQSRRLPRNSSQQKYSSLLHLCQAGAEAGVRVAAAEARAVAFANVYGRPKLTSFTR